MFNVVAGSRKRRVVSPVTLIASAAAHVLVFGGVVFAASGPPSEPRDTLGPIIDLQPPPPPPPPVKTEPADPPPPAPPSDTDVEPVKGETVVLQPPTEIADEIPPPALDETPITPDMVSGLGRVGDVIGTPDETPGALTGVHTPPSDAKVEDYVLPGEMAEEQPVLERNGLARTLERNYPPNLRDSGISGRVLLEVVVDENGRVRARSAKVVETTHAQFGDAAIRAAERLRFQPAKLGGVPVPVRVVIPIVWTVGG